MSTDYQATILADEKLLALATRNDVDSVLRVFFDRDKEGFDKEALVAAVAAVNLVQRNRAIKSALAELGLDKQSPEAIEEALHKQPTQEVTTTVAVPTTFAEVVAALPPKVALERFTVLQSLTFQREQLTVYLSLLVSAGEITEQDKEAAEALYSRTRKEKTITTSPAPITRKFQVDGVTVGGMPNVLTADEIRSALEAA